jgi:hypothetical protein
MSSWDEVKKTVDAQAGDEGLWFVAGTASEAYLQQELRALHAVIESAAAGSTKDIQDGV